MTSPDATEAARSGAAARLGAELEAALVRELLRTWHEINACFFKGALRPPVLRLGDGEGLLGRWDRSVRSIELCRRVVIESSWTAVVEVLRHEMAHQYAHEVLGAIDETAHGPAFRTVCERLGIDPAAGGMPAAASEPDPARARVLKRVAGLLALAESPNRHEAETAASVAQRLMLKHNIELCRTASVQRYGFRQLGEPKGRVQESEHLLAAVLAEHFFVEAIWVPGYRPCDAKRGSVLEISGTPENLEMASYAHAFLSHTAERLWREHRRAQGLRSNRDRRGFLAGVMEGFRDRLAAEKRRSQEQGLVWLGDAELRRFHRRRHPHIRHVQLWGHGSSDARTHGRAAGRRIVLHPGVGAAAGRPAALPAHVHALPARRG
ncbi:MAG: DUF2786 domain-containing protein [Deltaproteobacteria bacterium]|nr:DUF2786 domain-containing protein [Deltaproteobacteria bacterium]